MGELLPKLPTIQTLSLSDNEGVGERGLFACVNFNVELFELMGNYGC